MKIPIYQIDAFADKVFAGNPAAVCPLDGWLADEHMQVIAAENNLSETAFFVRSGNAYELRWFTPAIEIDLCGHATLAAAFVIFTELGYTGESVTFKTRSGDLIVSHATEPAARMAGMLVMDFPSCPPEPCAAPAELVRGLGIPPRAVLRAASYLAIYDTQAEVRELQPAMELLGKLDRRGVIVTAPGEQVDFVSRYFAPAAGVPEDPVTGSAHCTLTPYWAERLGRQRLRARQISRRGGELICEQRGERVAIMGRAVKYLAGSLFL